MITMIWIMITLLLTIIEFLTINITATWFIFGAIIALILNNYKVNFAVQVISFVAVGLFLHIFVQPRVEQKIFKRRMKYFNHGIINQKGKVVMNILPNRGGEVLIEGKRWPAVSDSLIRRGDEIKVKRTDGLTLIVEKTKKAKKN